MHIQKLIISFVFIAFSCTLSSNAQNTGLWLEAELDYRLPKGFKVELSGEMRSYFTYGYQVDQFFPQIELGYRLNKHLNATAAYRFVQKKESNGYFYTRNRYMLNLTARHQVNRFTIRNRVRYQSQYRTYVRNENDMEPAMYLRDKLDISYNIRKKRAEPYISAEVFYPLSRTVFNTVDEYRFAAGVALPVDKKHAFDVGLMYTVERFRPDRNAFVFTVGYDITIR